jgi:hypothetical protein
MAIFLKERHASNIFGQKYVQTNNLYKDSYFLNCHEAIAKQEESLHFSKKIKKGLFMSSPYSFSINFLSF